MLTDVPRRKKITDERLVFSNGNIVIPSKPGLGLEYDISEIEKYPYRQRFLRHYNGELTDIRPTSPEENILYFDFK